MLHDAAFCFQDYANIVKMYEDWRPQLRMKGVSYRTYMVQMCKLFATIVAYLHSDCSSLFPGRHQSRYHAVVILLKLLHLLYVVLDGSDSWKRALLKVGIRIRRNNLLLEQLVDQLLYFQLFLLLPQ